jgi:hypothetical protein
MLLLSCASQILSTRASILREPVNRNAISRIVCTAGSSRCRRTTPPSRDCVACLRFAVEAHGPAHDFTSPRHELNRITRDQDSRWCQLNTRRRRRCPFRRHRLARPLPLRRAGSAGRFSRKPILPVRERTVIDADLRGVLARRQAAAGPALHALRPLFRGVCSLRRSRIEPRSAT